MKDFFRRTIRYFLFIGVGLFGVAYELMKSDAIRWPLIGGYLIVIAASVYGIRLRSQSDNEEESAET